MKALVSSILTGLLLSSSPAETTYWLPIVERTPTAITYRYAVKAPAYFNGWLAQKTVLGGGELVTKKIDGQDRVFLKQYFTWDSNNSCPAKTGQIRLDNKKERFSSSDWKNEPDLKNQADLIRALDSGAAPSDSPWRSIDLLALQWDGAAPPQLVFSEEIPKIDQLMARRAELAKQTRPGKFYPNVKVPADLEAYRAVMLEICNLGRRDPDYRKANKVASDLRSEYTKTDLGMERVFHHNKSAPLFRDLEMDDRMNDAAQLQAEWAAQQNYMGHDGPPNYKGKNLKDFGARIAHLAPKYQSMVEAGGWLSAPEGWMRGETHYRPWFNVYIDTAFVGFGAAIGGDGQLRAFGVACGGRPHIAGAQSTSLTFHLDLAPGTELEKEKKYPSADGRNYLVWQKDGNVAILYPRGEGAIKPAREKDHWVWGLSDSQHKIPGWQIAKLRISAVGQLEAVDKDNKVIWTALNKMPELTGDQISQEPVVLMGPTPDMEIGKNLALGKEATQSSTAFNGHAKLAVNGNTSSRYDADAAKTDITHTEPKPGSWWQVDLGKSCEIKLILIWNRNDMNWERLQNFYIMVSEDPITENSKQGNSFSGPHSFTTANATVKGHPVGVKGRYVRIFLDNGDMPLSLGEVQVLGK